MSGRPVAPMTAAARRSGQRGLAIMASFALLGAVLCVSNAWHGRSGLAGATSVLSAVATGTGFVLYLVKYGKPTSAAVAALRAHRASPSPVLRLAPALGVVGLVALEASQPGEAQLLRAAVYGLITGLFLGVVTLTAALLGRQRDP
jgi:hypothetical protein